MSNSVFWKNVSEQWSKKISAQEIAKDKEIITSVLSGGRDSIPEEFLDDDYEEIDLD